jgi:hypothetical protein
MAMVRQVHSGMGDSSTHVSKSSVSESKCFCVWETVSQSVGRSVAVSSQSKLHCNFVMLKIALLKKAHTHTTGGGCSNRTYQHLDERERVQVDAPAPLDVRLHEDAARERELFADRAGHDGERDVVAEVDKALRHVVVALAAEQGVVEQAHSVPRRDAQVRALAVQRLDRADVRGENLGRVGDGTARARTHARSMRAGRWAVG